jgi:hypothetical protein
MPRKISQLTFCLRGFHYKCHFQWTFDDNLSLTNVFMKQIFRAVVVAPPPPPQGCECAGGGVVVAFFSHKPWLSLWLWSRIRVNPICGILEFYLSVSMSLFGLLRDIFAKIWNSVNHWLNSDPQMYSVCRKYKTWAPSNCDNLVSHFSLKTSYFLHSTQIICLGCGSLRPAAWHPDAPCGGSNWDWGEGNQPVWGAEATGQPGQGSIQQWICLFSGWSTISCWCTRGQAHFWKGRKPQVGLLHAVYSNHSQLLSYENNWAES